MRCVHPTNKHRKSALVDWSWFAALETDSCNTGFNLALMGLRLRKSIEL